MMEEFKSLVTEVLTGRASAILSIRVGFAGVEAPRQRLGSAACVREDRLRQDRPAGLPDFAR